MWSVTCFIPSLLTSPRPAPLAATLPSVATIPECTWGFSIVPHRASLHDVKHIRASTERISCDGALRSSFRCLGYKVLRFKSNPSTVNVLFFMLQATGVNLWPGGQVWPTGSLCLACKWIYHHCQSFPPGFYSTTQHDTTSTRMFYWYFSASTRTSLFFTLMVTNPQPRIKFCLFHLQIEAKLVGYTSASGGRFFFFYKDQRWPET